MNREENDLAEREIDPKLSISFLSIQSNYPTKKAMKSLVFFLYPFLSTSRKRVRGSPRCIGSLNVYKHIAPQPGNCLR